MGKGRQSRLGRSLRLLARTPVGGCVAGDTSLPQLLLRGTLLGSCGRAGHDSSRRVTVVMHVLSLETAPAELFESWLSYRRHVKRILGLFGDRRGTAETRNQGYVQNT